MINAMMSGIGMMMGCGVVGLMVALFLISLIVLIVAGVRWTWRHEEPTRGNALEILKQRYARGEIEKEEFERMKDDLK